MSKSNSVADVIECPAYKICRGLEIELGPWCRYQKSQLPPAGLHRFNPKDAWCPPGVRANLMLLAYMLGGQNGSDENLQAALKKVRCWAAEMRSQSPEYRPAG